jgi:hypothetical protein
MFRSEERFFAVVLLGGVGCRLAHFSLSPARIYSPLGSADKKCLNAYRKRRKKASKRFGAEDNFVYPDRGWNP